MDLSNAAIKWAADRGISRSILEQTGAASNTAEMPGIGKCEVIAFPYRRQGKVINFKCRALDQKCFKQKVGGEIRFWNLDAVLQEKSETVYIVEGEIDGLSLLEAGIPAGQVVSATAGRGA